MMSMKGRNRLDRLIAPRSIAVVGASDRAGSYGDTILRNLERLGFDGELWGVNPKRDAIRGIPCVPTLDDLPGPVDAVGVSIPAAGVPEVIGRAAALGCGGAVVVSAGFGEIEGGRGLERRLREAAVAADFPVCGPNGNGVIDFVGRAGIWGDSVQALPAGGVALISQSGNVAVNALGSRRGIRFHTVVSTGNQAVCDASDWLGAVAARDGVRSIALFLESDGDGERLAGALASCAERGIGVAVLKVGTSVAGAAAAAAHTGSLAGDQRVFKAFVEEAGACWADDPHELLELARVLAEPRARPSGSGGAAVLTCSGGDSGIAADEADRLGLDLPRLAPATEERLRALLPEAATVGNPLDYTSLLWEQRELLAEIVRTVGDDEAIDQLLIFHDTPEELSEESEPGWRETRGGLADGAAITNAAVLMASTLPDLIGEAQILELAERRIPAIRGIATAVKCARELRRPPGDPERLREIAAAARRAGSGRSPGPGPGHPDGASWLGEAEAKALIAEHGIPVPDGRVVTDDDGAVAAWEELGGTVVAKLTSPLLRHKSDIGAVALGLASAEAVRAAALTLGSLEGAPAGARLLIERQADPGLELIVAARSDAVVPALVIGLGGIWTETLADVVVVPLPAPPARVEAALRSLRGAPLLLGERGGAAVDLGAVANAAAAAGNALLDAGLALLELNPLIAGPDGAVAVDALALKAGHAAR